MDLMPLGFIGGVAEDAKARAVAARRDGHYVDIDGCAFNLMSDEAVHAALLTSALHAEILAWRECVRCSMAELRRDRPHHSSTCDPSSGDVSFARRAGASQRNPLCWPLASYVHSAAAGTAVVGGWVLAIAATTGASSPASRILVLGGLAT